MPEVDQPTEFEQAWERTDYEVETPAQRVRVRMTGDSDLDIWIFPTWLAQAPRAEVEQELAAAARLLYVARTRAYYATLSRVVDSEIRPVTEHVSDEQRRYFDALERLHASGSSHDGRVRLSMVGVSHFVVSAEPGAIREGAGAFAASCREAAMACFRDHTEGWQRLHFDVYTRPKMERAGLL